MSRKNTKGSVFDAIEEDAGVAEQLKIKAALTDCIRSYIKDNGLTQQEAGDIMSVQRYIPKYERQMRLILLAVMLLSSSAAIATPTVNGSTISWPNDGWYQVQRADTYESICDGGISCDVEPGAYTVINHSTGERFSQIMVGEILSEILVQNNTISWPDDGWYQVQDQFTYAEVCVGGRSCSVEPGTYVVINHSTGNRFNNIDVIGGAGDDEVTNGVVVTGNTISWSDNGWYQVQDSTSYESLCEGGTSCEVQAGSYVVINHSTGERFRNIDVEGSDQAIALITMDNHVELLENIFDTFSGRLYRDEIITAPGYSDPIYDSEPLIEVNGDERIILSPDADVVCSNGGTAAIQAFDDGHMEPVGWNFNFDNCQDGITLLDGSLTRRVYEGIYNISSGFSRVDQAQVMQFSGDTFLVQSEWGTTDLNFSWERGDEFLFLEGASSNLDPGARLDGGFMVRANWTGGQDIFAQVRETFVVGLIQTGESPNIFTRTEQFETGELELSTGIGNTLLLEADTGDIETVRVTIVANGATSTLIQPWSLWQDSLTFR